MWLNVELRALNEGMNIELQPKTHKDGKWIDLETNYWGKVETYDNKEIGAYTTWFDDPSTSAMIHFMTVDNSPVECLYKKIGAVTWQTAQLFADKPFPNTSRRVRWFKLEGLEADTIYETKLKDHEQVHRFKTMPNNFIRGVKTVIISDQINSVENFQTEGVQGFTTIHDNDVDVIVIAGDVVHDDGTKHASWLTFWDKYFEIERERDLMIPMVVCFGNHDGRVNHSNGDFKSLLWYHQGATKDNVVFHYNFFSNLNDVGYGAIDIGNYLSLVFLNSAHTQPVLGLQTTWLGNTLQQRQGRHIFPFFHVSPYPGHYNYNTFYTKEIRENWTPLFSQYGVKIVGNGHEHVHLVTKKVLADSLNNNGVVFTGQGHGMGNITRDTKVPSDTWYVDYLNNTQRGFDIIEFKVDGYVELKKVTLAGDIMYQKTL